jgi:imidazolonepropionase-like amidohydrolase
LPSIVSFVIFPGMNNIRLVLLIFFTSTLISQIALSAETAPPMGIRDKTPQTRAFVNARIVISPNESVERGTLVIKDGLVVSVGEDVTVTDEALVIDLDGKTIYPGFVDPFTEYGLKNAAELNSKKSGQKPVYVSKRIGATSWNDALHPEKAWVTHFEPDTKAAEELLKLGFTTVQSSKMDGVLRGQAFVALLGKGSPNDLVLNADAAQFASYHKGSSRQEYPSSQMGAIALLRQTFLDADWYQAARAAYEKNPLQAMPEFNSSIRSMSSFRGERYVFETEDVLSLFRADALAREFSLDIVPIGSNLEYSRLEDVKATGRIVILPVNYPEAPEVKTVEDELDVTLGALRHWERAPANPAALESAGIEFAFTTHRLKKKSDFLKNIRTAIKHGLSEETALAALTTIPAQICGVADRTGTLEPGKLANFFICDGSIFEEETKEPTVYSTWTAGRQTELVPLDQVDFRGEYDLEFRELKLQLKVTGELDRLRGSLSEEKTEIKLKHISAERDKLHFTARLDSLGIEGLVRFSGRMRGDSLTGICITSDADRIPWRAVRTAPYVKKSDTSDDVRPGEFVSRLTYPNIGYGFETLPEPEDVLVKNATVWTCEGDDQPTILDVLIRDGRYSEIGSDLSAPSGVRVIDATGKQLTPGIIDEHSHMAASGNINEGSHSVTPEVRIGDIVNPKDINIYRALAGGTTLLQTLHGSANPIGGQCQVLKLRWGSPPEAMKYAKAPPTMKWALGENVKQSNWGDQFTVRYPQSRMGVETIMKDALQAAVENEREWDTYNGLRNREKEKTIPPRRDLALEALLEVIHSRMFVTCHSYHQSEILMTIRLAEEFGFAIQTFTHILEGFKVAGEMAAHGSGAGSFSDWWAYKFEVYDAIQYSPCIMSDKGVTTCINSDSPELGRRLNQEAAKSVMYCDMDPVEALKMVTINPAKLLRIDEHVGSIKVGKEADFVIWNGDPLSVYSRPEQTWLDGCKYFDLEEDQRMQQSMQQERMQLIQKVLGTKIDRRKDRRWDWDDNGDPHADH